MTQFFKRNLHTFSRFPAKRKKMPHKKCGKLRFAEIMRQESCFKSALKRKSPRKNGGLETEEPQTLREIAVSYALWTASAIVPLCTASPMTT